MVAEIKAVAGTESNKCRGYKRYLRRVEIDYHLVRVP